jgi:flagellar assembly protein FliH
MMPSSNKIIRGNQAAELKKWNVDSHVYREMRSAPININGDPIDYEAMQNAIDLQTLKLEYRANEIETLKQEALKEAYQQGHQAGYDEGFKEAQQERQILIRLATSLKEEIEQLRDQLSERIMTLSTNVARRILFDSIEVHPESVVHIFNKTVETLNKNMASLVIHANASSIAILQAQFGQNTELSGIRLVEDKCLAPGGFRLVHSEGEIDLTLETRWQRIIESVGRKDDLDSPDKPDNAKPL